MKKAIILIIILVLLSLVVQAYQFNNSNYKIDMDFVNGGVQENNTSYNTSSALGGSVMPFNASGTNYRIQQGLYYILGSTRIITEILEAIFNFFIKDYGVEWVKLNWTETPSPVEVHWSEDNETDWRNITSVDDILEEGVQSNLHGDTLYYFRGRNSTVAAWGYLSQRTRDTAEVDDYYLYIVVFIVIIILLGLGYYLDDPVFSLFAGMLLVVTAITIFNTDFINLTNEFLKNGIVILLIGIGLYYLIAPTIKIIQEQF